MPIPLSSPDEISADPKGERRQLEKFIIRQGTSKRTL
jgi:hypothetical protein